MQDLNEFESTNLLFSLVQANKKRTHCSISGSNFGPLVTSDSGLGGNWNNSGKTTPSNDHLHIHPQDQDTLLTSFLPHERDIQAAALKCVSNSPQPDSLNHQAPLHLARQQQQEKQQSTHYQHGHSNHMVAEQNYQGRQLRFAGRHYSSGDDSSFVPTMTSQSRMSDQLIQNKAHQHVYKDTMEQTHCSKK